MMSRTTSRTEQQWLEQARALVLHGDFPAAESALHAALAESPGSFELRRTLAGLFRQTGRDAQAEMLLRELLDENPQDAGSAFTLAQLLTVRARTQAAGQVLLRCFESGPQDAELAIRAIELLDDADRKADAATIADIAMAAAPDDARLHAYAGMSLLQLGEFERARRHLLFAMSHSPKACEWNVPHGLASAQRYSDATHPDFTLLRDCLSRTDLSDRARSSLLFALGKAHDDIGEYGQAAHHFRQANALAHALTLWSRKDWRRAVEARLASAPFVHHAESRSDFIPVFIVGMPRSGTTLLAERLSRYPGVCNRGELPWIARLAQRADLTGAVSPEALKRAADVYMAQAQQDDSAGKRWFVDKQPLNFRYVDLMLALFPNAKIIHCTRNLRDTALSLWMQSFGEDVQGYAYDFDDIAVVMRDCARMMARWRGRHPEAIRMLRYEELVAQPDAAVAGLADWLGASGPGAGVEKSSSISTASLWQARQPVYSSSLQRWRRYAEYVPELSRFADEA